MTPNAVRLRRPASGWNLQRVTTHRLARFFGNSPEFWMNLQQIYDLSKARLELNKRIEREVEAYSAA